jgi:hypothetical protein
MSYVAAYLIACVGGYLIVGAYLYYVRRALDMKAGSFLLIDFLIGCTERAVALTLVLWTPPYVPAFIGGWVLLKFAIGWQRVPHSQEGDQGILLALTANVISFAIALGVGLFVNPGALQVWAAPSH